MGQALGSGEQAVSWHADSSLEPFSSIAVLNLSLPDARAAGKGGGGAKKNKERRLGGKGGKGGGGKGGGGVPWRIAMKCVGAGHEPTAEGARGTPALAVPLQGGDVYYMLDDFNHHHHHAVLAGSCGRISSTHRVAVTATDTWQHIWARGSPEP